MAVKDTRQVASELQSWIATTDPRASSAGINYEQVGDNLYNVSLTFSVESTDYTQIEEYLATLPRKDLPKKLSEIVALSEKVTTGEEGWEPNRGRLDSNPSCMPSPIRGGGFPARSSARYSRWTSSAPDPARHGSDTRSC